MISQAWLRKMLSNGSITIVVASKMNETKIDQLKVLDLNGPTVKIDWYTDYIISMEEPDQSKSCKGHCKRICMDCLHRQYVQDLAIA